MYIKTIVRYCCVPICTSIVKKTDPVNCWLGCEWTRPLTHNVKWHKYLENSLTLSFYKFIYLFIYLWLCWVFVSARGLSLVAASGGHSSSRCAGLSLSRPLLLRSTGSRRAGSVIVAHGPSCSAVCRIFPDQGLNPCPLHWQADSQPLRHQGSPDTFLNSYKHTLSIRSRLSPSGYLSRWNKCLCPYKDLYTNIYSRLVCNSLN